MAKLKHVADTPENRTRIAAEIDWARLDAMTDQEIAGQVDENPDSAPIFEPVDIRAVIASTDAKTTAEFASRYHLNCRSVEQWLAGRRKPDRAAKTLLRLIQRDPKTVARLLQGTTA